MLYLLVILLGKIFYFSFIIYRILNKNQHDISRETVTQDYIHNKNIHNLCIIYYKEKELRNNSFLALFLIFFLTIFNP